MTNYLALLRAINVGGTGKLLMEELKALCNQAGFINPKTYIASGNVIFKSELTPRQVKEELETHLLNHAGKPIDVIVRTDAELNNILRSNPFSKTEPKFTSILFLDQPPSPHILETITGRNNEEIELGEKEIFIHYPTGMGQSKLNIPITKIGTARNLNTVSKLVELLSSL